VSKILTASASLNFPSISAVSQADLTITVTGAAVGDEVMMALPAAPTAGLVFNAFVSAADTVTIRASNITASPVDAAAATYGVIVVSAA
jgi:putative Ca2+/H+ antiporter (TMEM165/GDT1 family)